ncbi:MAG TPA: hypothetical protein VH575_20740, partial [Gemmataceae bacterium]
VLAGAQIGERPGVVGRVRRIGVIQQLPQQGRLDPRAVVHFDRLEQFQSRLVVARVLHRTPPLLR